MFGNLFANITIGLYLPLFEVYSVLYEENRYQYLLPKALASVFHLQLPF